MPDHEGAPEALRTAGNEVGWRRILDARNTLIDAWGESALDVDVARALAGLFALDALARAQVVARVLARPGDEKGWVALRLLIERRRNDLMRLVDAPAAQAVRGDWPPEGDTERRLANAWARLAHDAGAAATGFDRVLAEESRRLEIIDASTGASARRALRSTIAQGIMAPDDVARLWNLHRTVAGGIDAHGFGVRFDAVWNEVAQYGVDGLMELPWFRPPMSAPAPQMPPPDASPVEGAPRSRGGVLGWLRRGSRSSPPKPPSPATRGARRSAAPVAMEATGSAGSEPPAAVPRELRRTPHLDLSSERVSPDATIDVSVWVDRTAARAGEEVEDVVVTLPEDTDRVQLKCYLLVSPQLEVSGPATLPLELAEMIDTSERLAFRVRVRDAEAIRAMPASVLPDPTRASISAVFAHNGRPSGSVTRMLDILIDAVEPVRVDVTERAAVGTLRVDAGARPPDLLVQVRAQPINDGRQFQCRVSTPLIDAPEEDTWADWNLSTRTDELVRGWMKDFVADDLSPRQRLAALNGAGIQLWDAAPAIVRSLYWRLVDTGHEPRSIAIVSDEPFIPWELMTPHRRIDGRRERRAALGVEAAVGRWILEQGTAAPQRLSARNSIVIAPRYAGSRVLAFADEEADLVLEHFPGIRIEPASLDVIDERLATEHAGLLHFVCHGSAEEGPAQTLYLDNDERLNTTMLAGLPGFQSLFESGRTMVVLNACEVGRPSPALIGVGGFARTFIDLGAAAVLAALWSVKDTIAHGIARDFYAAARANPQRPLADIVREIRARAWSDPQAEDTYAAYCFYGDPLASLSE